MKKKLQSVFFIAVLWGIMASGCTESAGNKNGNGTTDYCGDIKAAVYPVINGVHQPDPSVADLSGSQIAAVGAIIINYGVAMCTATLIAPNVVLTAAHCVDHPGVSSIQFVGGENMWRPDFTFFAWEWHRHPDYSAGWPNNDVAVIRINGDTAALGVTPIPVSCDTLRLIGKTVQAVGYGDVGSGISGWRWWTTLYVNRETPNYYSLYGDGMTGMCSGDSGGPALYTKDDGEVYVVGVTSSIDSMEDCLGHTFYPRTDYNCEFIREYVPEHPCEGETLQGRCDGSTAVWCEDDAVIMTDDCDALGYTCGPDAGGNYRCLPPVDPCEGETFEGRCDGNTAVWCEADAVNTWPCPDGTLCGALDDGLYRCIDECVLIGRTGRCDENDMARWCEDGQLKVRDCGVCEQICGWVNDALGYYCI